MNKKALFITLGFVGAIILVIALFVVFFFANTKKLVCKSTQGNITLRYTKKEIVGYTAKNMTYDLDEQQQYSREIGVDAYLKEFTEWFENNTDGTCK